MVDRFEEDTSSNDKSENMYPHKNELSENEGRTETSESEYEGQQEFVKDMELPNTVSIVEEKFPEKNKHVSYVYPEMTALCPKSGHPDFYNLKIVYNPNGAIIELKSLKLYLASYRNVGIFHEHLTSKVLEDILDQFREQEMNLPEWIYIQTDVHNRGGVYTSADECWSEDIEPESIRKKAQRKLANHGKNPPVQPSE